MITEDHQKGADDGWRVSSFSSAIGSCVQVKFTDPTEILVRDTKDPGPVIRMTPHGWASLLSTISGLA